MMIRSDEDRDNLPDLTRLKRQLDEDPIHNTIMASGPTPQCLRPNT
jgi:hypothetical protein